MPLSSFQKCSRIREFKECGLEDKLFIEPQMCMWSKFLFRENKKNKRKRLNIRRKAHICTRLVKRRKFVGSMMKILSLLAGDPFTFFIFSNDIFYDNPLLKIIVRRSLVYSYNGVPTTCSHDPWKHTATGQIVSSLFWWEGGNARRHRLTIHNPFNLIVILGIGFIN